MKNTQRQKMPVRGTDFPVDRFLFFK